MFNSCSIHDNYMLKINTNYHELTTNYSRIIFHFTTTSNFSHLITTFFPLKIYTPLWVGRLGSWMPLTVYHLPSSRSV